MNSKKANRSRYSHWVSFFLVSSTGFAMFSMFFGSGNLVFPLAIGNAVQGQYIWAMVGLLLTGVFVPFLGLKAIVLFDGSYEKFFARLGKYAPLILPLLMLSIMGPFGVIPRCITVAHGSFLLLFPETSLLSFSIVMSIVIFFMTHNESQVVSLLGIILTPVLLLSLIAIVFFGIKDGSVQHLGEWSPSDSFSEGFLKGYQTMDLLASFFFASVVIHHMKNKLKAYHMPVKKEEKLSLFAMILGAGLLAVIYTAFVYLGAAYTDVLDPRLPEQALGVIAAHTLGPYAAPILCTAVILACLTTAVVLTLVFAEFLQEKITLNKLNFSWAVILTLIASVLVSTLKFKGIAAFIGPILEIIYPGLILMVVLSIFHRLYDVKTLKWPVYTAFLIAAIWYLFW